VSGPGLEISSPSNTGSMRRTHRKFKSPLSEWLLGPRLQYFCSSWCNIFLFAGRVEYFYQKVEAWQVSEPGVEVFHFQNGQREAHHGNGSREVIYPDGSCSRVVGGEEQSVAFQALSVAVKQPVPSIIQG